MLNPVELNSELSPNKMKRNIDIALKDPKRYFNNFLCNEAKNNPTGVPEIADYLHCCVWAFIYTNEDSKHQHSKQYYIKYQEDIEEEIEYLKSAIKSTPEEEIPLIKYPIVRDLVYSEDREILIEHCNSVDDYLQFLEDFKDSCSEFKLYAKYKISLLGNHVKYRFNEISEVINSYPYSDIFDIESLKAQCKEVNGLIVCFSSDIPKTKLETIQQIIECSKCQNIDNQNVVYVANRPLSKADLVILQDYDFSIIKDIISDSLESVPVKKTDVFEIQKNLNISTGLNWGLPERNMLNGLINPKNINNIWWKEDIGSLNNIEEYHYFLPIITISHNG